MVSGCYDSQGGINIIRMHHNVNIVRTLPVSF